MAHYAAIKTCKIIFRNTINKHITKFGDVAGSFFCERERLIQGSTYMVKMDI